MIEEDGCQETSLRVGEVLLRELMALRDEFEVVGDVRGKGLMVGIELVKNKVGIIVVCGLYTRDQDNRQERKG